MNFTKQDLYAVAQTLKSDDGENPEYDRALVELISYLTGEPRRVVTLNLTYTPVPA